MVLVAPSLVVGRMEEVVEEEVVVGVEMAYTSWEEEGPSSSLAPQVCT